MSVSDTAEYQSLVQRVSPPTFVKQAAAAGFLANDYLPSSAYAVPGRKLFRIDNPAAIWVSTLSFLDKRAEFSGFDAAVIDRTLQRAAEIHGIGRTTIALRHEFTKDAVDESILPDSDFVFVVKEAGSKTREFPICNPTAVQLAASFLEKHATQFTAPQRRQFATKVLEKSAEFATPVENLPTMEKYAGLGVGSAEAVATMLVDRARLVGPFSSPQPVQISMVKLAKLVLANPSMVSGDNATQLVDLVDTFDRQHKVAYSDRTPAPEDVVFGTTRSELQKFAADNYTLDGSVYSADSLNDVPLDAFREHFGDDFANTITRDGLTADPQLLAKAAEAMDQHEVRTLCDIVLADASPLGLLETVRS